MNRYLIASCFRNTFAKNHENQLILSKVTVDNVGVPFLRHSVFGSNSNDNDSNNGTLIREGREWVKEGKRKGKETRMAY